MNNIIENRRSIRKFKQDIPVPREQLDELICAAMLAPSAYNNQPWEFIALTNRDILIQISEILPNAASCKTAPAAIVIVALPKSGRLDGYYPQECGAAAQNILLQAADMGLGACWCGVWPVEDRIAAIQALLNVPESKIPFCVIAVGTADEIPRPRKYPDSEKIGRYIT